MNKIVLDLDNTITIEGPESYESKRPNWDVIEQIRKYQKLGYKIAIYTARNMKTHEGNVGKINAQTLPIIIEWLNTHGVPFDEIYVGKPWCGEDGFYVDDRAIRPSEFVALSRQQVLSIFDGRGAQ